MHRIDTDTASPDENGVGKAGFRPGAPPGVAATRLNAAWCNAVQEELVGLAEGLGETLDADSNTQALLMVRTLVGRTALKASVARITSIHDTAVNPELLNALARKASTGQVIAVGTAASIQANSGPATNFATVAAHSGYTGDFNDIAYDATLGLFIPVGDAGEIQTSSGGAFTRRANGGSDLHSIATNGLGLCVATGDGELIKYSTNGTTWNTATSPFAGSPDIRSVAFGAGVFVVGTMDGDIASSADGITWTVRRAVAGSSGYGRVVYDSALGFLYAYDGDVFHSADGITWTKIHDTAAVGAAFSQPGLVASPWGWLVGLSSADGTSIVGRYSATAVDHAADFSVDYATDDQLRWMKFIDGQLWAVGGDRIYTGGLL